MSYILDALRKAESERKLGSVPDLHQQAVTAIAFNAARPSWGKLSLRLWVALVMLVAVIIAAVAWLPPRQTAPLSQPSLPLAQPVAIAAQPPVTAPSQPALMAKPIKPNSTLKIVDAGSENPPPRIKETKSSATPDPVPEVRAGMLSELPEKIQKELPTMTINGYLYASIPAERTVLINNRLLREGDQLAPGLTLEKIMPKDATLNYMGYRFRLSY